jgi:hypothetical protein
VITEVGPVELDVPRDRDGTFEPRIVPKRARRLGGVDELVISLVAKGLAPPAAMRVTPTTLSTPGTRSQNAGKNVTSTGGPLAWRCRSVAATTASSAPTKPDA